MTQRESRHRAAFQAGSRHGSHSASHVTVGVHAFGRLIGGLGGLNQHGSSAAMGVLMASGQPQHSRGRSAIMQSDVEEQ
jgi:hypothetical protein